MEYKCIYKSPIGKIILLSNGSKLTGLWLESSRFKEKLSECNFKENSDLEIFSLVKNWLDGYFNKEKPDSKEIPLELIGTEFSSKVWEEIRKIPYGHTATYGDIAKAIAKQNGIKKMSAQAVGYAVGHNPVSIIVPCHRVVGANGNLTGYGGGINKKIALLELEGTNMEKFYIPKRGNAL